MKLLIENWRKYEKEVLEEGMLGDIAASIKAGFKKLIDAPVWFDNKVEETRVSFEETIELIGHSVSGAAAESVIGAAEKVVGKVMPPKLKNVLVRVFSNFIGSFIFGFIDNFIMVVAGGHIDTQIGAALGGMGGSMFAAGLGNTVSDIAGKLAEKKIK